MAHEVIIHPTFVEVLFSGEVAVGSVRAAGGFKPEEIEALRQLKRLLFDFSAVTNFGFDPLSLGSGIKRLSDFGLALAIVSTNPLYFGIGRQIALYSGVEGDGIAVFVDRPSALMWLLGERGEGGSFTS